MIARSILMFICISAFVATGMAQTIDSTEVNNPSEEKKPFNFKERTFFGGGFGAQFGNNTVINVAPLVGIKLTEKLSAGTQVNYTYARLSYPGYLFQDHIIGGSVFSRYFIWSGLFAHAEGEMLNANWSGTERSNVYSILGGGGYMFRFGNAGGFSIMALYNFIPNQYGINQSPVLNMGFTFGL